MNIVKTLIARLIEARLNDKGQVNKGFPCKVYTTEAAAEKATAKMADDAGKYFTAQGKEARSARYVVIYVAEWDRWVGCIDLSELMMRPTSTGGYMGFCSGFFSF